MRYDSVPADSSDVTAFVEIWLTRLELGGLLDVLADVLNQDFGSSRCEQVFPVWIKLKGLDWDSLMDLSG